jgi:hypothetical protein
MTTKKCPFCDEEIHAEASSCDHCGRDLVKAVQSNQKMVMGGVSLGVVFWIIILTFSPVSSALVALAGLGLGVLLFKRTQQRSPGIALVLCSALALLVSGTLIKVAYDETASQRQAAEQKRLVKEQAEVDANNENLPDRVEGANEALDARQATERLEEARALAAEGRKLSGSDNCAEMAMAERYLLRARELDPNQRNERSLNTVRLSRMGCYQGNHDLQMAVRVEDGYLLTLYVWMKNVSEAVRHADPENFTLVTKDGQSLSASTSVYRMGAYFEAVNVQPNTVTKGYLVFETRSKPKTLVYKGLSTQISRDFP